MSARALIILATLALGACASAAGTAPRSSEVAWSVPEGLSEREAIGAVFSLAALVEARLGRRLDVRDWTLIDSAAARALTTDNARTRKPWRNRRTGNSGVVGLARAMEIGDGRICRIVHHDQWLNATRIRGTVTLCRRGNTQWRVADLRWWRLGDDFASEFEAGPAAIGEGTGNRRMIVE